MWRQSITKAARPCGTLKIQDLRNAWTFWCIVVARRTFCSSKRRRRLPLERAITHRLCQRRRSTVWRRASAKRATTHLINCQRVSFEYSGSCFGFNVGILPSMHRQLINETTFWWIWLLLIVICTASSRFHLLASAGSGIFVASYSYSKSGTSKTFRRFQSALV